ncbi:TPA: alpha/beta hydrolase [Legionella pneumophila subsp. pneumophila]|uniref:Dot/Icm T4SS effector alpha/beta hydrolase n=1 Tax=Legionella pneumophila TaxID=446 RepID=UPI0009836EF8|nr:Dot/Icm T4SS effector alpha/beta hydrolase [Legionella pneumophila]HAT9591553.1 alpha/beta hydrolase [Legionella pneumophila subsp. pneumophila]OOK41406.1 Dot/Icm system substrate protein SdbB [Legionella pneumophila subsp. pneumophila str. Mississauga]HAT1879402.1 alpha/beta hydrolase [Legionella pneumophila]HCC3233014.1 alpha/beta hydrolase [Legionella pneumophila subsp. pneumophila]HDP0035282.1 alpha/beta hydrolase [Legionella pneumophila]
MTRSKESKTENSSFFQNHLKLSVAKLLFSERVGDWYKKKGYGAQDTDKDFLAPFADFLKQQKTNPEATYYNAFQNLKLTLNRVPSQLVSGDSCELEVLTCEPEADSPQKTGTGKHIVYFPGANTYYQACFRDISAAAKETGATVHALNYPGIGMSTGEVVEANDLTNAGIAVVLSLLNQGVKPDDIVLQGDCFGASVALEVKNEIEKQADIKVRLIMNNAFKSFKAAVSDLIDRSPLIPSVSKSIVKNLLEFTGWNVAPGQKYIHSDPYQCYIQHEGDQTLTTATLSSKVAKYKEEIRTGRTTSRSRDPVIDKCPEEYKPFRDFLDENCFVRVRDSAKERLAAKFGVDSRGEVNAHFADLCELEMLGGQSVYEGFVNNYLVMSDKYIKAHPQKDYDPDKINFLSSNPMGYTPKSS